MCSSDLYGSISNQSIISKTLLPELTVDEETKVAFYDFPGYTDSKNVSWEIATTYFIKKVTDYADRVKVVAVVHDAQLSSGDRWTFSRLLQELVDYIKNPTKFSAGIAFVSTNVEITQTWTEWRRMNQYSCFLEIVHRDLPDMWYDSEQIERGQKLVEILATSVWGQLKNCGLFRRPNAEGCLDEMQAYQCAKHNLRNLVFNDLAYIDTRKEDFGYRLSPQAHALVAEICQKIESQQSRDFCEFMNG